MRPRILYCLRHAKAAPAEPGMADHDRPLATRGKDDAKRLGAYMHDQGMALPQAVLCSTAKRTQETLTAMEEGLGQKLPVKYSRALYHASPEAMLRQIADLPDSVEVAMVIGHNPGMHQLVFDLARGGKAEDLNMIAERYPTGGLAVFLQPDQQWYTIADSPLILTAFLYPTLHKEVA